MKDYYGAVALYGRDITVKSAENPSGRAARGLISPLDSTDTGNLRKFTGLGPANKETYLLIANPLAIASGETGLTVTADGKIFDVLRAEPVYFGGSVGHWEGVLRLKGGAAGA